MHQTTNESDAFFLKTGKDGGEVTGGGRHSIFHKHYRR